VTAQLYEGNSPKRFWRLLAEPEPGPEAWDEAVQAAVAALPPEALSSGTQIETLLWQTLGEGQFGPAHWELGKAKRAYYALKPLLPRSLTRRMKQVYGSHRPMAGQLGWPVESRYVQFQFDVIRHLLEILGRPSVPFIDFWPGGRRYAFVLTHDIETAAGQSFARKVADLDASFGFRSSFNFVPERYRLDRDLIDELRSRGFEIGVHGLRHDGRDFDSRSEFMRRAPSINRYLKELGAVGFRAPLTHRQPEWMQALDIEYDGSFFDSDPYEPIAGGTMCIWPFQIGRFIELPYSLTQDYTLASVLRETTPRVWLEKVDFISANRGMALLNTHPDYLASPPTWKIYSEFLSVMSRRADYYHALPRDVARWWRARAEAPTVQDLAAGTLGAIDASVCESITRWEPANPSGRYASRTEDARRSAARIA
jgi:peptidoglycan/xylan/chitin deacetylase (PgdA/CDA1 family)